MNPLQQLITERLAAEGISQRQAAGRSGGRCSAATLSRIASGITVNLTQHTIDGLALALDLPRSVVAQAADNTARPRQLIQLSEACARLPVDTQQLVVDFLQQKLTEHEEAERARIKAARPHRRGGR